MGLCEDPEDLSVYEQVVEDLREVCCHGGRVVEGGWGGREVAQIPVIPCFQLFFDADIPLLYGFPILGKYSVSAGAAPGIDRHSHCTG